MHFSAVTAVVLAALCTGTQAWQVTAYNNVGNCKANRQSTYRVISGATNNDKCITFDGNMPDTSCRQYNNGGTSNGGCSGSIRGQQWSYQQGLHHAGTLQLGSHPVFLVHWLNKISQIRICFGQCCREAQAGSKYHPRAL
ncbi:hypothetical protein NXS19_008296 [Fusarium pseudograminearum]|nr:hypothetical protein NXS19_008296 [Fusarium pseudograminearum]